MIVKSDIRLSGSRIRPTALALSCRAAAATEPAVPLTAGGQVSIVAPTVTRSKSRPARSWQLQRWDEVTPPASRYRPKRIGVEEVAGLDRSEVTKHRASIGYALEAQAKETSHGACCDRCRFEGIPGVHPGRAGSDPAGAKSRDRQARSVPVEA